MNDVPVEPVTCTPKPQLHVHEMLNDVDRHAIVDTLKQLDGLKKQLHRLLGK